ncbi:quinon protein alcohol dehydrogenase-like superfamily [Scleroderma yunnanense]
MKLDDDIGTLLAKISQTYQFIMEDETLAKIDAMKDTLAEIAQVVQETAQFIVKYAETSNFWKRIGKNLFSETRSRVTQYNDALDRLMQQFRDRELRDIHVNVIHIREELSLEGLAYVGGVGLNTTKQCLEGTRTEILNEIIDWINDKDLNAPRIFWLHGQAGKGKSSIAHTIALHSQNLGLLGSCFCFTRFRPADKLHEKVFTTIARDLADRDLRLKPLLAEAVAQNHALKSTSDVLQQWNKFISEPLSKLTDQKLGTVVIVVDALDETGSGATRKEILHILKEQAADLPPNFRIFITSRPEVDIRDVLPPAPHVRHQSLDVISPESAEKDVRMYITAKLKSTGRTFKEEEIEQLVKKSDGLFEWARLACDFVTTRKAGVTTDERFQKLVSHAPGEDEPLLDEMYEVILRDVVHDSDEAQQRYRSVMRQILYTLEPLPLSSLNSMRQRFREGTNPPTIEAILEHMASLLSGITDESIPVRPLHTSFYDFLTDPKRSKGFFIDKSDVHHDLTRATLITLQVDLSFNICGLETSYLRNSDFPNLDQRIANKISKHLSYSCRYWATHLQEAEFHSDLASRLKLWLDSERILFWMEVLGLLKLIDQASPALAFAAKWLERRNEDNDIIVVIKDAMIFLHTFATVINESVPHLYLSALPFSPAKSVLATRLASKFPNIARLAAGRHEYWPSVQRVMRGHNADVYSVAFSADRRHIVSGSDDCTIRLWDAETGIQVGNLLEGHTEPVTSVAFSLDGKYIASGSDDLTIRLWDVEPGIQLGDPLKGHTAPVLSVAFSPDGTRIVSGSRDQTIRLWDAQTQTPVGNPLRGHVDWVKSVVFSPDGKLIASGSFDRTIRLWSTETGIPQGKPLRFHTNPVLSIAFSSDGQRLVSGSKDKLIQLWDISRGWRLGEPIEGHTDSVRSVAFFPDGKHIVSGSEDKTIRIWDVETGAQVGNCFGEHTEAVLSVSLSPDGKFIASGSADDTVRIWDAETGAQVDNPLVGHMDWIRSVAYSPDGKLIVLGSDDMSIQLWDVEKGTSVGKPLLGHTNSVLSVAFSPDGKWIASGSDDTTIRLWDLDTRSQVGNTLRGHTHSVLSVGFSPSGEIIASGSEDMTIRIWDVATGAQVCAPLSDHNSPVWSVAFSPDGQCIASASDQSIQLWDAATGARRGSSLIGHTHWVKAVAFSPDGKVIVSGSADATIRLWDVETGAQRGVPFEGHKDWVRSVAFSPDGKVIMSGSSDKTIRLWDAETGLQVGNHLKGHTDRVRSVAFSPDGRHVVSGSDDKTIRIWNVESNAQLGVTRGGVSSPPLPSPDSTGSGKTVDGASKDYSNAVVRFSSSISHALQESHKLFVDIPSGSRQLLVQLEEDGWIVGPNGRLLLWLPSIYHSLFLYSPLITLVIPRGSPELDLSKMVHGPSWHECFVSSEA